VTAFIDEQRARLWVAPIGSRLLKNRWTSRPAA
jgi:hypothetical protein